MRWAIGLGAVLLASCTGVGPPPVAAGPTPTAAQAAAVIRQAADLRRAALAGADPADLAAFFGPAAVADLRNLASALRARGALVQEDLISQEVVHSALGPGGGEVVLQEEARDHPPSGGPPGGATVLRQWWVRLGWSGARWLVMSARDLSPAEWWPAG